MVSADPSSDLGAGQGKDAQALKLFDVPRQLTAHRQRLWNGSLAALLVCAVSVAGTVRAEETEIVLPASSWTAPIRVQGPRGMHWKEGAYDVWTLTEGCQVSQGGMSARADRGVVWIDRPQDGSFRVKAIVYLEGEVEVTSSGARFTDQTWLGRFFSHRDLQLYVEHPSDTPVAVPDVYTRGRAARRKEIRPLKHVGFLQESPEEVPGVPSAPAGTSFQAGGRRVQIFPRSAIPFQLETRPGPTPDIQLYVVTNGVRVVVEGVTAPQMGDLGKVILEADRVVIWGPSLNSLMRGGSATTPADRPLEVYLEGNIVFRQGDRVVYAERMYYNASQQVGTILAAELFTGVPSYEGILRLKADVIRQLNDAQFQAQGAALTTSRIGRPRYWLQSNEVLFEDRQKLRSDAYTGLPAVDPESGAPLVGHDLYARSRSNFVYVGGLPVFYWPSLETNLKRPTFYVDRVGFKKDDVFGTQAFARFDVFQLLGTRRPPEGVDWTVTGGYFSDRGVIGGTRIEYDRPGFLWLPGPTRGYLDAWGVNDRGFDNLGADRRMLTFPHRGRGRATWRHQQRIAGGWRVQAEAGWISDANFLEQYFEREWDLEKDQATGFQIERLNSNRALSLSGNFRLNDFFTQTEWMPRLDHSIIGQPLAGDWLTWHARSHVGYARLRTADPPFDPADAAKFDPLAWEVPVKGVRAASRQELDLPLQIAWAKVVPYALGEVAYYQEDINRNDTVRYFGQLGVRSSVPIWSIDPSVQDTLWNLQGMAHKIVLEGDFFWSDASNDLAQFPLYDALDDDSIEHFRRRFYFDTFGGVPGGNVATRFDERNFAFRSSLQRWVAGPSTDIVDDLAAARMAIRQRWQTKRGAPGNQRVVDWIVLDMGGTWFVKPDRDNFGENFGMLNYDFRWHLGDRFSIVSDGYADLFTDGLQTASVGGILSRPGRGRLYVGFRSVQGAITSQVLNARVSYRMTEKWIANLGTSFDFGATGNIGQSASVVRIGESMLVRAGAYYDESRNNLGFIFSIEPRFLPNSRFDRLAGIKIPPVGAEGLE